MALLLGLALLTALLGLLAVMLLGFVVLPVWALIACATSPTERGVAKAIWIVLMLVTWPVAGLCYAAIRIARGFLRAGARWCLILIAALSAAWLVFGPSLRPKLSAYLTAETAKTVERLDSAQREDVPDRQLQEIKQALQQLTQEIGGQPMSYERIGVDMGLRELMDVFLLDRQLTAPEAKEWQAKFMARDALSYRALQDSIEQHRRDAIRSMTKK